VFFWIPAAGMTAIALINVAVYRKRGIAQSVKNGVTKESIID